MHENFDNRKTSEKQENGRALGVAGAKPKTAHIYVIAPQSRANFTNLPATVAGALGRLASSK